MSEPQPWTLPPAGTWGSDAAAWGRMAPSAAAPASGVAYAELPLRVVAFLLDLLLLRVLLSVLLEPVYGLLGSLLFPDDQSGLGSYAFPVLVFLAIAAAHGAAVIYCWRVARASPGQMLLGLFTLDADAGTRLSVRQAILRWLILFVPALLLSGFASIVVDAASILLGAGSSATFQWRALVPLIAGVWLLLLAVSCLNDERGRGTHDRISGSVVVRRGAEAG